MTVIFTLEGGIDFIHIVIFTLEGGIDFIHILIFTLEGGMISYPCLGLQSAFPILFD